MKTFYRVNESRLPYLIGMVAFSAFAMIAVVAVPIDVGRITVPMVGVGLANSLVAVALARAAFGGVIVSSSGVRIRNPVWTHRLSWESHPHFVARPLTQDAGVDIGQLLAEDRGGRSIQIAGATPPRSRLTLAAAAQVAHELNVLARNARLGASESGEQAEFR